MKRLFSLSALLIVLALASGCVHVEPGHVGVEVDSCSGGGVKDNPVGVGYHGTGPCTSIIEYPTNVQTASWTKDPHEGNPANEEITFTNVDGLQFAADISLSYQLDGSKAPAFYTKFKADDISTFTHGFLRNVARQNFDAVGGKCKVEQIMGDNKKLLDDVQSAIQKEVAVYGINIIQFGFIGAPRPPQAVTDSINAKIQATQIAIKTENELRATQAQAAKNVAEATGQAQAALAKAKLEAEARRLTADSEAYMNKTVAASLTPELVAYIRAKKWDGAMPKVAGAGTIVQLGLDK